MEVLWKMARSQSALSHSPGMILGKNMKRSGERIHVVKANLYSTVISQEQNVQGEKSRQTGFTKEGYRIIRFQINHGERIKLVHPYSIPKKRTFEEEVLSHRGNVFLTFIVEDLKSTLKKIRSKVTIFRTEGEIVEVRKGVYLSIIDDPDGNHIELVEYNNLEEYRSDLKLA